MTRIVPILTALAIFALPADARQCLNKFLARPDGPHQVVTLLTGKLTFDEAKALAAAIASQKSPPVEWVDDKGKTVARQFGELRIVRPMPVGCDDKPSGVVMIATFPSLRKPQRTMLVKLDEKTTVEFSEQ